MRTEYRRARLETGLELRTLRAMRSSTLLGTLCFLAACGDSSPTAPVDASTDASTGDASSSDGGADAPVLPDATLDSGVKVPAAWSKSFPKVDFVDVSGRRTGGGVHLLANMNGGDLGDGPRTNAMAVAGFDPGGMFDAADSRAYDNEVGLGAADVTIVSKGSATYLVRKFNPASSGSTSFDLTPAKRITPLTSSSVTPSLEIAADSLASGADTKFGDTSGHALTTLDFCVYPTVGQGTVTLGCTTNTASGYIAIDSGTAGSTTASVSGRQLGPTFDYQPAGATATNTSGAGYFVAFYASTYPSKVKVIPLGGTPLVGADSGASSRSISRFESGLFVAPFKGTMDFGKGPLVAPSTGHAIAIGRGYDTGFTEAYAYSKGPASEGKASSPMVNLVAKDEIILVDLIWDWIDIGGTKIDAIHPKGDLLFARINLLTGKLSSHALYGGPGAIDRFGVAPCAGPSPIELCVAGQTEAGLDFGQGPLAAGMFLARINLQ